MDSKVNKFLNKKNRFEKIFKKYKEFVKVVEHIESLLTPEQQQILEFKYKGEIIDLKTQLLLYFEDRYDSGFSIEELKEKAAKVLKKYSFLFETNWNYSQIRTILIRELMAVISIGPQCFYYRKASVTGYLFFKNKLYLFGNYGSSDFMRIEMKKKYWNLPGRIEKINNKDVEFKFLQEFFWNKHDLFFEDNCVQNKWKNEFFKKTKWFFEQLNSCEEEYRNKYREKIYKEACFSLGLQKNYIHAIVKKTFYKNNIKENLNTNLQKIIEEVINYFEEKELITLSKIDSQGKQWSFKEQMLDRYYPKYPSIAPLEEIKTQIRKIVLKYKPFLLLEQQTETIKELLFEELEQELFISKSTHDWNKEMFKNLYILENKKISKKVKWAVDQTIKFIEFENIKKLSLKTKEKEYNLETLLIARWGSSWLARGKNYFKTRLLLASIKNDLNKEITSTNFQAIFEELDSCFLLPYSDRIKNVLLRKDGTGDISKFKKNIWTAYVEFRKINTFSYIFYVSLLIIFIIISGIFAEIMEFVLQFKTTIY